LIPAELPAVTLPICIYPSAIGSDAILFNGLLHFLSQQNTLNQVYIDAHTEGFSEALNAATISSGNIEQVATQCKLNVDDLQCFYQWFASHEKS